VQICEDLTNFGTLLQQEKPWTGSTVRWIGGALGVVGPGRLAAREHYGAPELSSAGRGGQG
jgi:hypothetical protein